MPAPHQRTPIASLPLIARVIDGQLEAAEEEHRLLLQARPGSLDNATVERVVRVFSEEQEFLAVYQEQLARWRRGPLTPAQRGEVDRLAAQVVRNVEVAASVLALAEDLKVVTIDALLAKSDLELGLELLTGDTSPLFPRDRPPREHP